MATAANYVITSAAVSEVQDREDAKSKYVFKLEISWSNGEITTCHRGYQDFFEFHCKLLDTFPSEAGDSKEGQRSLPFLPGKQIFRKSNKALALKRLPELDLYVKELVKLPEHIGRCEQVLRFLRDDWDEDTLQLFKSKRNSALGTPYTHTVLYIACTPLTLVYSIAIRVLFHMCVSIILSADDLQYLC